MFETLAQYPWWMFCTLLTCGAAGYGILMRYVPGDIDGSVFSALFTGVSSIVLGSICLIYFMAGGTFEYTSAGLTAATIMGLCLVVVDLGIIQMYRAGAPVSLGMPLVRSFLALATAVLGVMIFSETMTHVKIAGVVCVSIGIFLMGKKPRAKKEARKDS